MLPRHRLSSAITLAPRRQSASAMCEPMKPAPPVTNAFTRARLSKRAPGEQSFFSNRADFGSWRRIGSGHFCLWHQGEAARPWERLDPDPAADSWRSRVAGLAAVAGLF